MDSRWLKIGPHKVDWSRMFIGHKEYGGINAYFYPLILNEDTPWEKQDMIVIVRGDVYKKTFDMPKGLVPRDSVSGIVSEHISKYHKSIANRLEYLYPGIDLEKSILVHEEKKPSYIISLLLLVGGLVSIILTVLTVLEMASKSGNILL